MCVFVLVAVRCLEVGRESGGEGLFGKRRIGVCDRGLVRFRVVKRKIDYRV